MVVFDVGDTILFKGEQKLVYGRCKLFINSFTYLVRDVNGSPYDDKMEHHWKKTSKLEVDYDKLIKGMKCYWVASDAITLVSKNTEWDKCLAVVIKQMRKEIGI